MIRDLAILAALLGCLGVCVAAWAAVIGTVYLLIGAIA